MSKKPLKLFYRTEAGNIIGTGHLMEIVTLHQELGKYFEVDALACINASAIAEAKLRAAGVQNIKIFDHDSWQDELQFYQSIGAYECDAAIFDLLNRSSGYYSEVTPEFKRSLVILDHDRVQTVDADVCINFSITQKSESYKNFPGRTEYWLGPDYFPFDSSIRELMQLKKNQQEVRTIFINQGGSDPYALTVKILNAIEELGIAQRIIILVGGALRPDHYQELQGRRKTLPLNYEFHENIPMKQVHELMAESDLAITAAGNTLYELAFMQIPCLVISHNEDHDCVAVAFEKRKAILNLGIGDRISQAQIQSALTGLLSNEAQRHSLSQAIGQVTKGQGMDAIRNYLENRIYASN